MATDKFDKAIVEVARKAKIAGVRAGDEHRYTGVWIVVVENRLFVRSWNDKPTGWFQAFRKQPIGRLQLDPLELSVRGKLVRSSRICDAVTKAFGEKYNTKGSQQWVKGFAEAERAVNTLEFVPNQPTVRR
jgi:hypothetical protein